MSPNRTMTPAIMLVLFLSVTGAWSQSEEERVTIKTMIGQVEVRSGESVKWRPARPDMPIRQGWDVRTFVESSADLGFASGTIVKVGENSVISVSKLMVDKKGGTASTGIKVATGQMWANVKKLTNTRSSFEFETPTAVASIRGTRLGIQVGQGSTSIDVYEGLVAVKKKGSNREVPVTTSRRAIITSAGQGIQLVDMSKSTAGQPPQKDPFAPPDSVKKDSVGAKQDTVRRDTTAGPDTTVRRDTTIKADSVPRSGAGQAELPLRIVSPADRSIVRETPVTVRGLSSPGATVMIKGKEVAVGADGAFSGSVELELGINAIQIAALLGPQMKNMDMSIDYRPPLTLTVGGVVENMEVFSADLPLDVEVSQGARFSVNGREGASSVRLNEGRNVVTVRAWDQWNTRQEQVFAVTYRKSGTGKLDVGTPRDGDSIFEPMIMVAGIASPGARVTVNNATVPVSASGSFSHQIPIPDEPQDYSVTVIAQVGDEELTVERTVSYRPKKAPFELVISSPVEGQRITQPVIRVQGKTSPGGGVVVKVNDRSGNVTPQGAVSAELTVGERNIGEYQIDINATRDDEERSRSITVIVDNASPQINTSVPTLTVDGAGIQATRIGRLTAQVSDRTPEDQITLVSQVNGSVDEETMEPGASAVVTLNEGKNTYTIKALDKAKNQSNSVAGEVYFLPGPLAIDILEPSDENIDIGDLPPLPRGVDRPRLKFKVKVDDGIGDVPKTIKFCRIMGAGQSMLMKDNGDYTFSGEVTLPSGSTVFTIQTEDLAGNQASKMVNIRLRN